MERGLHDTLPMSRVKAVAASTCLALLVAACAAEPSAPSDDDGVAASSASALSTADAVARAEQWATAKLHYCQAPNHGRDYDSACSGKELYA